MPIIRIINAFEGSLRRDCELESITAQLNTLYFHLVYIYDIFFLLEIAHQEEIANVKCPTITLLLTIANGALSGNPVLLYQKLQNRHRIPIYLIFTCLIQWKLLIQVSKSKVNAQNTLDRSLVYTPLIKSLGHFTSLAHMSVISRSTGYSQDNEWDVKRILQLGDHFYHNHAKCPHMSQNSKSS